ncbi:MAG: ABC transporter permease [Actinobacteria bacterium]|jgi:peptide/nickel transport system permease protein|nr:MAG: ABC transporter permease [Actinomycetota bacterium]
MAEPATDFTLDTAQVLAEEEHGASIVGRSPWYLAWRRLRRNYIAFIALFVFVVIAVACSLAPIYAHHIAHTAPNATHTEDIVNGKQVLSAPVIGTDAQGNVVVEKAGGVLGPTWWHAHGRFVLGADGLGRDVAVRLLYGGLNSLKIGIGSALICVMVAVLLALLAGFYGGWVDWIITRSFDLIWAFPVLLLAIALGSALSINGFHHFGISISPHSLWIPTLVISYVYVPYVGRPLRGQILSLREKEFIEAAIGQGASPLRIMFSDLLPNVASTALVFFTLIIANNILTEAGLSFLGAGVQPPNPSWGTVIQEGQERIISAPWLTLAPGIAIVLTVLSLNIFGDGLRDALDPRAKVRVEH